MPPPRPLPSRGTFRLHPFAEPPVPAGSYLLTGAVSGLPGPVDPLDSRVHVTAPRYALPPDQVLGTFPPAGARGSFTSRLPQIVLRRRTLPWERSTDLDANLVTTPTPWLALVLIAEGEGRLLSDVPVGECVTSGVDMGADTDVSKAACLEVPLEVVNKVFPTVDDLRLLSHVRSVDLQDTELALGDDDGWMAVVLGNRLPQPDTRYLACLINVEHQLDALPTVPQEQAVRDYVSVARVFDLRMATAQIYGGQATLDTVLMGLTAATPMGPIGPEAAPVASGATLVTGSTGPATVSGEAWATEVIAGTRPTAADAGTQARLELADGFSFPIFAHIPKLRFPVLSYWSFTCEEQGDFQYLATNVHVRMLGHVVTGPETPDGDPITGGPSPVPDATRPEPPPTRPLPLVAETGHIEIDALSRRGEAAPAWFRGPLTPAPVPRVEPDAEGRVPLAHHADQLCRVVPDGREDLGYAAAFEMGRLLALSQPAVVASLGRWRRELFGAARVRALVDDATAALPDRARALLDRPDPLGALDGTRAATLGARAARAVVDLLGEEPIAAVGMPRPVADPGAAADVLVGAMAAGDEGLLAGLGVEGVLVIDDGMALLDQVAGAAVTLGDEVAPEVQAGVLRSALEDAAMVAAADAGLRVGAESSGEPDALDRVIDDAARRAGA